MDKNRLFWASRRGMLELDLILAPFADKVYPGLGADDQKRYEQLLQCEDQDLFAWLLRRKKPEDEQIARIINIIMASRDPATAV
ncbi:MAG: response regulator receiver protein [Gammaproteobacteria bacterium]|nr:MAG: response regulator receiver protein [Gammaproteobacteria bacterium]